MSKKYLYLSTGFLAILAFLFFKPFYGQEGWPPYASEITAAILGALFTTLITQLLLIHQSESEEGKERNLKIYEEKLKVYSALIDTFHKVVMGDSEGEYNNELSYHDKRKIVKCAYDIFLVATTKEALLETYRFAFFVVKSKYLYEDEVCDKGELEHWVNEYNSEYHDRAEKKEWSRLIGEHSNRNEAFSFTSKTDIESMKAEIKAIVPSIGTVMISLRRDLADEGREKIDQETSRLIFDRIDYLII